jgi:hypothetical protein
MAAPNLISITTVIGKTQADWCPATLTSILANGANTSEVLRINGLFITNVGNADASVNVNFQRSGLSFYVAYNNLVPVGTTSVIMGKDNGLYLEEGDALRVSASSDNMLQYVITYEVMS